METDEVNKKNTYKPMIWLVSIVVVLWIGNMIFGLFGYDSNDSRGTFGDMFGAVNALFSGLAFAGLIFTISLQRKDLAIQFRTLESQLAEMETQSKAAEETAKQLESQQQLINLQMLQSTVNNLINIKSNMIEKFKYTVFNEGPHPVELSGMDALSRAWNENIEDNINLEIILNHQILKQYYATFIYTLQFIYDSKLLDDQKKILADILNIQTFNLEILLIFRKYNNSQHELSLLKTFGFSDRHRELKELVRN